MRNDIVLDFKPTGICIVDVAKVARRWSKDCFITQWKEEYRLCDIRTVNGAPVTKTKVTISEQQAKELAAKLCLVSIQSTTFKNAYTWRKSTTK